MNPKQKPNAPVGSRFGVPDLILAKALPTGSVGAGTATLIRDSDSPSIPHSYSTLLSGQSRSTVAAYSNLPPLDVARSNGQAAQRVFADYSVQPQPSPHKRSPFQLQTPLRRHPVRTILVSLTTAIIVFSLLPLAFQKQLLQPLHTHRTVAAAKIARPPSIPLPVFRWNVPGTSKESPLLHLESGPVASPVAYLYVSSPFGRRWGRHHLGIDLAAPEGRPIVAIEAGTVVSSGWEEGYGQSVVLDHGHGRETRYAHCSRLFVHAGEPVKMGEKIALIGTTGHSTGPHLHFEVIIDGERQDPMWFYRFPETQPIVADAKSTAARPLMLEKLSPSQTRVLQMKSLNEPEPILASGSAHFTSGFFSTNSDNTGKPAFRATLRPHPIAPIVPAISLTSLLSQNLVKSALLPKAAASSPATSGKLSAFDKNATASSAVKLVVADKATGIHVSFKANGSTQTTDNPVPAPSVKSDKPVAPKVVDVKPAPVAYSVSPKPRAIQTPVKSAATEAKPLAGTNHPAATAPSLEKPAAPSSPPVSTKTPKAPAETPPSNAGKPAPSVSANPKAELGVMAIWQSPDAVH